MDAAQTKSMLREQARARRRQQANKDSASQLICQRFFELDWWESASTVLVYVGVRSEVRTRAALPRLTASGKKIVVPYVEGDLLRLFLLQDASELVEGRFSIPEPHAELRTRRERQVSAESIDLAMVPGVAFDVHGVRLGHGLGYFDKLLAQVRESCRLVALAFECQIFPSLPAEPHDILMDLVLTETSTYRGQRWQVSPDCLNSV